MLEKAHGAISGCEYIGLVQAREMQQVNGKPAAAAAAASKR